MKYTIFIIVALFCVTSTAQTTVIDGYSYTLYSLSQISPIKRADATAPNPNQLGTLVNTTGQISVCQAGITGTLFLTEMSNMLSRHATDRLGVSSVTPQNANFFLNNAILTPEFFPKGTLLNGGWKNGQFRYWLNTKDTTLTCLSYVSEHTGSSTALLKWEGKSGPCMNIVGDLRPVQTIGNQPAFQASAPIAQKSASATQSDDSALNAIALRLLEKELFEEEEEEGGNIFFLPGGGTVNQQWACPTAPCAQSCQQQTNFVSVYGPGFQRGGTQIGINANLYPLFNQGGGNCRQPYYPVQPGQVPGPGSIGGGSIIGGPVPGPGSIGG